MDQRMEALQPFLDRQADLEEMAADPKVEELFSTVKNVKKGIRDHLNKRGYKTIDGIPLKTEDVIQKEPIKIKEIKDTITQYNTPAKSPKKDLKVPAMPFNLQDLIKLKELVDYDIIAEVKEIKKKLEKGEDLHYTLDTNLLEKYKTGNSTKSMRVNNEIWKEFNNQIEKHNQLRQHTKGEALNILFSNIIQMMKDKKI